MLYNSKMNIIERVKKLNFPLGEYVIIGGGILDVLGIRATNDVDAAVTPKLFKELQATGEWEEEVKHNKVFLKKDDVDINPDISWSEYPTTNEEAIASATVIDGVPFLNLGELKRFKTASGREKDLADLVLIEKYQSDDTKTYKGTIIENSLRDKSILNKVKIEKTYQSDDWIIDDVFIAEHQIVELPKYIDNGPWYIHVWKPDTDEVKVIFKNAIFNIKFSDKSTWNEAVAYGKSIGIPEGQLTFQIS